MVVRNDSVGETFIEEIGEEIGRTAIVKEIVVPKMTTSLATSSINVIDAVYFNNNNLSAVASIGALRFPVLFKPD